MVRGMRAVSVEKGYDPRDFALVAFGGGGPLHASELAREGGLHAVLVPPMPGVTSALGLLVADLRYDESATFLKPLSSADPSELAAVYEELERAARERMRRDDVADDEVVITRGAEVRYARQSHELDVSVPSGPVDASTLAAVRDGFEDAHKRAYGFAMTEDMVLVNAQVTAIASLPKPPFEPLAAAGWPGRARATGRTRPPRPSTGGGSTSAGAGWRRRCTSGGTSGPASRSRAPRSSSSPTRRSCCCPVTEGEWTAQGNLIVEIGR